MNALFGQVAPAPVQPAEVAAWVAELAALLVATRGEWIAHPARRAIIFECVAHRRLDAVQHDRQAGERLLNSFRQQ